MDTSALAYQIALPLLPEVGLQRTKQIVQHFGSAEAFFRADRAYILSHTHLSASAVDRIMCARAEALNRANEEIAFVQKHAIQTYWFEDESYPELLREVPDAPSLLFCKGNIRFTRHMLSIVGTRNPTDRGKQLCEQLVRDLAARVPDLTIVSGLAFGIDVCAHKAALENGLQTIAVPAHGLDRIYPVQHRNIAIQILQNGGILTEYMSKTEPEKAHFVARNRIVAGLTEATVVIESKSRGGSLITARLAMDYSRDVFAFPGRPSDVWSAGCNDLIRNNAAMLINNADDLIEALNWGSKPQPVQTSLDAALFAELTPDEQLLMDCLRQNEDGIHVNTLCENLQTPYSEVSAMLFSLELKGLVRPLPGGRYRNA